MKNHIDFVEIKNFKTLRNVKINTKRVNVFIGKPNVGKSNFLEALSLFSSCYSLNYEHFFSNFIRYKKIEDLFYDKEIGNDIQINTNIGYALLRYHFNINNYDFVLTPDPTVIKKIKGHTNYSLNELRRIFIDHFENKPKNDVLSEVYFTLNNEGKLNTDHLRILNGSPIKKYDFTKLKSFPNRFHLFLLPPTGENLYSILQRNKRVYKEINNLFKPYKLRLILDSDKSHIFLQKLISGIGYTYDYYGIADTLQRYIYYLLAIETNKDSVLLFEEPEAHSFPPYIRDIALKIAADKTNQFFITTHSPFVLNTLIEELKQEEISLFNVTYEKFQTHIHPFSKKEISDMQNYGNDIFFNLK